ncbi:MAG: hypothetical protein ACI86S_000388 [Paracoccaceae bacterium]
MTLQSVDDLMVRRKIADQTRLALERHFSTAQIMDMIAIQGMYVILGAMIETWGLALDDAVAKRIGDITNREDFEDAAARFAKALL